MTRVPDIEVDLFDGCGQGSLHICVVRDPAHWDEAQGDRHIERLDLHETDWEAVFYDVLGCSKGEPYVRGEDITEHTERSRRYFQQCIPQYPMLGRIFDMYEDYVFTPEEVGRLREECQMVRASTSNPGADKALRKLIYGCDEASKVGGCLLFSCD